MTHEWLESQFDLYLCSLKKKLNMPRNINFSEKNIEKSLTVKHFNGKTDKKHI